MQKTDAAALQEIDASLPVRPARAAEALLYLIAGLIFIGFVWAATAKLDRVTRGDGVVVPSNRLQEVQYFEGGIVQDILVAAGDEVQAGDVLIRVDPTQVNADLVQGREELNLLRVRILRLEAEAEDAPLDFPDELQTGAPQIVADERALFVARRAEYEASLRVQETKVSDAEATLEYAKRSQELAREEFDLIEPLVKKGVEPQIELVRVRQRLSSAESEAARARIAVERASSELQNIKDSYASSVADALTQAKGELAAYAGELPALQDKMDRTALRAPINGVVNRVLVATIGGVVQPGETVVELVPAGDTPLIRAKVKPSDIGFLRPGQEARVKLTAYDSSVYGSLAARIETIGADAVEDEKTGERYYEIWVRTESVVLKTRDGDLAIMPGMAAEVDILNGKRSVLAYLFKPLVDVKSRALREN